ncbi:MAG: hypothetical protein AB1646_22700 [Thermodesulfobacteriota bacterium]
MVEIVNEPARIGQQVRVPGHGLVVSLRWGADVEMDIMALYVARDGRIGRIYSKVYPGGDSGNLHCFPFMQIADGPLTGYGMRNQENLLITTLEAMREVHIAAFSYTDLAMGRTEALAAYRVKVAVRSHGAITHEIPLVTPKAGHLAMICMFDASNPLRIRLVNVNEVVTLDMHRWSGREKHCCGR